ncbi:MAG: zinc ribbon domain-containing protein [Oscillospiraceae bacterium]|nr:zinc ribbon domain-containing protein [Oscillospiraceae bacterium]
MFCKNCGNEMKDGVKFCGRCGNIIDIDSPVPSMPVTTNAQVNKKIFSFKILPKGRSTIFKTIKAFRGAYKADFAVEDNRLLVTETDNYGETVYSVPYFLIKSIEIKEKVSALFLFAYILGGLCALFLLLSEPLTSILVLALICAFIFFFGFKKITFSLLLDDDRKVNIKLMKFSNKQREEKNDFINSVNKKMQVAVNNGDEFKTAGTALTVSDVRNKVSVEEKMRIVESIKNGQ